MYYFLDSSEPLSFGFFWNIFVDFFWGLQGCDVDGLVGVLVAASFDVHWVNIIVDEVDQFCGLHVAVPKVVI